MTALANPTGDDPYKAINRTMKRFNYEKDALLEVLNTAQESFGYLSQETISHISHELRVPLSQVVGVATFYHKFTFDPLGEHTCIVCTGTACYVKGAAQIVAGLSEQYGIDAGETTPDGRFSLTTARCLGSCGLAPMVVLDGEVRGKETPESVVRRVTDTLSLVAGEPT